MLVNSSLPCDLQGGAASGIGVSATVAKPRFAPFSGALEVVDAESAKCTVAFPPRDVDIHDQFNRCSEAFKSSGQGE